jgi:hypothetical protein
MSRRLLALTLLLGAAACLLAVGLARELLAARPLPAPPAPRALPAAKAAPPSAPAAPAPAAYGVIAGRNLFSPSRSETPSAPVVATGPKPVLHGVVMDGPKSRAYLEDPAIKRTFGYLVGDTIGGGRVESIGADRVVIARSDGLVEVLLQDPSKPKPAPTAAPAPPASAAAPPSAASGPAVPQPAQAPGPPTPPPSRVPPASAPLSRSADR